MTWCIWRDRRGMNRTRTKMRRRTSHEIRFRKINRLKLSRDKDTILRDAIDKLRDLMGVGPAFSCGILALKSRM